MFLSVVLNTMFLDLERFSLDVDPIFLIMLDLELIPAADTWYRKYFEAFL
jgi:hypothetical protein